MTSEVKDKVSTENQIPIDKDKMKEEHRAELKAATDAYEQRCLLSFSTNRSGEVIKKYDFPTLPPYDETQKEDMMVHMMNQVIRQAFISHAPIMANSVHNVVLKMLQNRGLLGFVGLAYQQASHMVFAPTGSAIEKSPVDPQAQADGDVGNTQPISTIALSQFSPVSTHAQGNYMTGFQVGWNPATGFGMPPEYMVPSPAGQPSSSASQPMNQQVNASAPQPTQPQDTAPAPQPLVTIASAPSLASPSNMSAFGPTSQQ